MSEGILASQAAVEHQAVVFSLPQRSIVNMGEPYTETEELLDYEEEEEAAPDAVAAKANGETVKK